MSGKPRYPINNLTLAQINEEFAGRNGFNAVSTFSGCGGSSLGYKIAGYKLLWANEFIPAAQETYRANHPATHLETADIRTVQPEAILSQTGLDVGELDLFDGSPPCASFSTSGKMARSYGEVKKYSDTHQRVDDLFFQYLRLLEGLKPRAFIAENVSGLVKGAAKGYFKTIHERMVALGYRVSAVLVNGAYCGTATARERIIFIGFRNELAEALGITQPAGPTPLPYAYTLREAWEAESLYDPANGDEAWIPPPGKMAMLWRKTVEMGIQSFQPAHKEIYGRDSAFNHIRALLDRPAPTIVQGSICVYHPTEERTLSVNEIRRANSFPDDFKLTGTFKQRWERIGRAVPPMMMATISRSVHDQFLRPLRERGLI